MTGANRLIFGHDDSLKKSQRTLESGGLHR
jgi:hypothetical protein